jgi:UDP-2,3-diacylglucosamine hydrolase
VEAWFISDIHLKKAEERNGEILLRFLRSLLQGNPQQVHLFMLGDIFDLWVGGGDYFVNRFSEIVNTLGELVKAGGKVTFIEGNHDLHIADYFQKKLGVSVFVEAQYIEIDSKIIRVEHGDLINLNEIAYLRLRAVLRHPILKFFARVVPGGFWGYIGEKASKKSRKRSAKMRVNNQEQLENMIHAHTERAFAEKPFDFIISGHMHIFTDREMSLNGQKVRSVNLGSWFEDTVKVFRIKDGQAEWITLPG